MKPCLIIHRFIFIAAIFSLALPSYAQSPKSKALESSIIGILNYANYLAEEGKIDESMKSLDRAVSLLLQTEERDSLLALTQLQRAYTLHHNGRYAEAINPYLEVDSLCSAFPPIKDNYVIRHFSLNGLASCYNYLIEPEKAYYWGRLDLDFLLKATEIPAQYNHEYEILKAKVGIADDLMNTSFGGADQTINQLIESVVFFRKIFHKLDENEIVKEVANLLSHIDVIISSSVFPSEQYSKGLYLLDEFTNLLDALYSAVGNSFEERVQARLKEKYYERGLISRIILGDGFNTEIKALRAMLFAQINDMVEFTYYSEVLSNDTSIRINKRYDAIVKMAELLLSRGWYNYADTLLMSFANYLNANNTDKEVIQYLDLTNHVIANMRDRYGRLRKSDDCLQYVLHLYQEKKPLDNNHNYGAIVSLLMRLSELSFNDKERNSILSYANRICNEGESVVSNSVKSELYAMMGDYKKSLNYADTVSRTIIQLMWAEDDVRRNDYQHAIQTLSQIDSSDFIASPLLNSRYSRLLCQSYAGKKRYEEALLVENRALQSSISDYLNQTKALSVSQRTDYFEKHYSKTLEFFSSIDYLCGAKAANSYNAALFQKDILTRQQRAIKINIINSDDAQLKQAYDYYCSTVRFKKGSAERAEYVCMQRYSQHSEFVDSFELPNWETVRNNLEERDIAIEFTIFKEGLSGDQYYAAIVLKREFDYPIIVRLCKVEELECLYKEGGASLGFSKGLYSEGGEQLYQKVWKPLEKYLKKVDVIYYAPYGYLNNINIDVAAKTKTSQTVGEAYSVFRLSTTALIGGKKNERYETATFFGDIDYDSSLAILPDSLPEPSYVENNDVYSTLRGSLGGAWRHLDYSKVEIDGILGSLNENKLLITVLSGNKGSETAFKQLSGKTTDLLHIATHGYYYSEEESKKYDIFNAENLGKSSGIRSGLILAGGNLAWNGKVYKESEDGILTADEISGMDLLGTEILVLSACQTALGDLVSDGVLGLQRSFKIAGVKTIIMSLWQVDDEATSLFMKAFYSNLLQNGNRHNAFLNAQKITRQWAEAKVGNEIKDIEKQYSGSREIREFRLKNVLPPEYYWAAFVILN